METLDRTIFWGIFVELAGKTLPQRLLAPKTPKKHCSKRSNSARYCHWGRGGAAPSTNEARPKSVQLCIFHEITMSLLFYFAWRPHFNISEVQSLTALCTWIVLQDLNHDIDQRWWKMIGKKCYWPLLGPSVDRSSHEVAELIHDHRFRRQSRVFNLARCGWACLNLLKMDENGMILLVQYCDRLWQIVMDNQSIQKSNKQDQARSSK